MRVLIYGINFKPELTGIGKYSGEMADWLVSKGYEVLVITAPPYYPEWSIKERYANFYSYNTTKNMTVIRCPLYVPQRPTALKRLLHLASFSMSSFIPAVGSVIWKPDLIIQVVPTMFCSIQTILLSKLIGAKSVVHIQDFEVDAMFNLSMVKLGVFRKMIHWLEKKILDSFQVVSTISKGMLDRAAQKGIDRHKLVFFPNWAEENLFKAQRNKNFLCELGLDTEKKIIVYSGNMGEKQGLELVIDAADLMRRQSDVHFVMVGEGVAKERLERLTNDLNLSNISFYPLLSSSMFQKLLASTDCHLVIQKKGAADAVLPSKLTNILAVGGNAVVTASMDTTLGMLCEEFPGIAVLVEPESADLLVAGIEHVFSMPKPNKIAEQYAWEFLDKDKILDRFFKEV
jgi:colanic acid biosynthesis glycosyl transferase WcaI